MGSGRCNQPGRGSRCRYLTAQPAYEHDSRQKTQHPQGQSASAPDPRAGSLKPHTNHPSASQCTTALLHELVGAVAAEPQTVSNLRAKSSDVNQIWSVEPTEYPSQRP